MRDRRRLYRRLDCAESGGARLLRGGARSGAHWLGASGRNGGQICSGYSPSMRKIAGWVGIEDAKRLWDMAEEAKAIIRDRVARHSIPCDLKPGYLLGAAKPQDLDEIEGRARSAARASRLQRGAPGEPRRHPVARGDRHLSRRHVRRRRRASASAQLQSRARARSHHGGREDLRGLSRVERIRFRCQTDGAHGVRLRHRPPPRAVRQRLIWATWCPSIRRKIMPVGTYIATTQTLGDNRARALIPSDARDQRHQVRARLLPPDRRPPPAVRGRVSYTTLPPANLGQAMRRTMLSVYPDLTDVTFEHVWGGNVAITVERTPHIGSARRQRHYFAHGFSGMGVALTGVAGKVIAEAIAGTAERFDVFARLPHTTSTAAKLLRTLMLALAMLWYRMRDWRM